MPVIHDDIKDRLRINTAAAGAGKPLSPDIAQQPLRQVWDSQSTYSPGCHVIIETDWL